MRFRHHLYSSHAPHLAQHLLSMLPSLREHECVNRRNLSFEEELSQTEMGHVFEHLVLELLSLRGVCTRGQTTWNWKRDRIGTYHVTIGTGKRLLVKESLLVAQAILTNALLGPVLRIRLPGPSLDRQSQAAATGGPGNRKKAARQTELPVYRHEPLARRANDRLLFALDANETSAASVIPRAASNTPSRAATDSGAADLGAAPTENRPVS